jgi:hypothetical protein
MKFLIEEFYKKVSRHINFHLDHTIFMTTSTNTSMFFSKYLSGKWFEQKL